MERSANVGICVQGRELLVTNMGTSRNILDACSSALLKRLAVDEGFISLTSVGSTGFDPRGLAIVSTSIYIRRTDDPETCQRYTIQALRGLIRREACQ
jgi:hypothetical protein